MPPFSTDDLAVHADFLRRLASRLLVSPDLAEDAVQETLVLAWNKQPQVESQRGWLTQVLRNVVRNQRRSERRLQERHDRATARRVSQTPAAILEREETRTRLLDAILGLPEVEREVVLLRYSEDLPPRKVAAELGLPIHTVHNRLRAALARLRARLGEAYGGEEQRWRGALLALVPSLPSTSGAAGLGGVLMGKKLVVVLTSLLVGLVSWIVWNASPGAVGGGGAGTERAFSATADGEQPQLAAATRPPEVTTEERETTVLGLRGRVLDPKTQVPVAGVRVTAFDHERLVSLTAMTDARGRFAFPQARGRAGAFHLVVSHPKHAPTVLHGVRASGAELTLPRQEGGWITGRLMDARGQPVQRYRLRAIRGLFQPGEAFDQGRAAAQVLLPAEMTVDRELLVQQEGGTFRVGPLQAGEQVLAFEVEGHPPLLKVRGAQSSPGAKGISVAAGQTTDLGTVTLPDVGRLRLKVVDADTEEVLEDVRFEAEVEVSGRRYATEVTAPERAEDGAYLVPIALTPEKRARPTLLVARRPGYSVHGLGLSGQPDGMSITMRMDRTASLRATVLRPDGEPLTRATAILRREVNRAIVDRVPLDARGEFYAPKLPAGAWLELVVFDATTLTVRGVYPLQLAPGEARVLTLGGPDQTALEGVFKRQGVAIAHALVSLDTPAGRRTQIQTDAGGRYRFDGLSPGVHEISIASSEPEFHLSRRLVLREGQVLRLAVDLDQVIHGTLTWDHGEDEAGASEPPFLRARLTEGEGFSVWSQARRDGSFVLRVPRAATYELSSAFSDLVLESSPRVLAGSEAAPVRLRLVRESTDGAVVLHLQDDVTGEPVPDASFTYRSSESSATGTAEKGVVHDSGLRGGLHRYVLKSPVHVDQVILIEITPERKRVERTVDLVRSNSVEVIGFTPTSRAQAAGLVAGDHLLAYGGKPTHTVAALIRAIRDTAATDAVTLEVMRDGERKLVDVPGGRMGVRVENRHIEE